MVRFLKHVFWKKSAFYIRYLHNNIPMLPSPTYSFSSTYYFIDRIFKIQKLKSFLEVCFLLWVALRFLWRDICSYKLFLISENKNTEYLTNKGNDHANVVKFMKITSISMQNRQKT